MIRAVLDANLVVSSLINPQSTPAQVLDAWRAERFQVVLSAGILDETGWVLRYPRVAVYHRWSEERLRQRLEDFGHLTLMTPETLSLAIMQEDSADNRSLECAVEGPAAYFVSGDRLLLSLGTY